MSVSVKTIFCDIDGVIFKHFSCIEEVVKSPEVLPGVIDTFREWHAKGYTIVLITGRPPSLRQTTEKQLEDSGISYHSLIMGLPRGQRVVINDLKADSKIETAGAVNVLRDKGLVNVDV